MCSWGAGARCVWCLGAVHCMWAHQRRHNNQFSNEFSQGSPIKGQTASFGAGKGFRVKPYEPKLWGGPALPSWDFLRTYGAQSPWRVPRGAKSGIGERGAMPKAPLVPVLARNGLSRFWPKSPKSRFWGGPALPSWDFLRTYGAQSPWRVPRSARICLPPPPSGPLGARFGQKWIFMFWGTRVP